MAMRTPVALDLVACFEMCRCLLEIELFQSLKRNWKFGTC
jgi:hypothetical protein